jgi:hypothetical protein
MMTNPNPRPVAWPTPPALLPVGTRVRFTGYRAASFDYPQAPTCVGTISSVKGAGQIGYDYWVKWDDGRHLAYNHNEVIQDVRTPLDEVCEIVARAYQRAMRVDSDLAVKWLLELPLTDPEYRRWVELTGWRRHDQGAVTI